MDAVFSPEPLLDFCMHYMHDYHASPHYRRFLLFYLAKIGENGGSRDNHAYNACKNQGVAQD